MPILNTLRNIDRFVISPASPGMGGAEMNGMGFTPGSNTWPTANKAIYIPFPVRFPITVVKLFVENGTTVSGNIDVGIYDRGGARLVSSGSTAQSGTSAIQSFDITDTTLNPGLYYLAVAMDNTTAHLLRWGTSSAIPRAMGVMEQTSAFALPSTATFAALSSSYIPFVAATLRTTI
jgi:hypothetical protein